MITVSNVSYQYSQTAVLENISFQIKRGEIFGVLGPNGSGKSTLLKLMCGSLPLQDGNIKIDGKPIEAYSPKQLAKIIAVLPQSTDYAFNFSVFESVRLGRYAHQSGIFPHFSEKDDAVIIQSLQQTGLTEMKEKAMAALSGGERQRVFLARALSQEPEILMLDEPTNHLDISHQMRLLNALSKWSKERGMTVVAIFHDLNIASLFCDRVLLLDNGKIVDINQPVHSFCENRLSKVYKTSLKRYEHPYIPKPFVTLIPDNPFDQNENLGLSITKRNAIFEIDTKTPYRCFSTIENDSAFTWHHTFSWKRINESDEFNDKIQHKNLILQTQTPLEKIVQHTFHYESMTITMFVLVDILSKNPNSFERGRLDMMIFFDEILPDAIFSRILMIATEAKIMAMIDEGICIDMGGEYDAMVFASSQKNHDRNVDVKNNFLKELKQQIYETIKKEIMKNKK